MCPDADTGNTNFYELREFFFIRMQKFFTLTVPLFTHNRETTDQTENGFPSSPVRLSKLNNGNRTNAFLYNLFNVFLL